MITEKENHLEYEREEVVVEPKLSNSTILGDFNNLKDHPVDCQKLIWEFPSFCYGCPRVTQGTIGVTWQKKLVVRQQLHRKQIYSRVRPWMQSGRWQNMCWQGEVPESGRVRVGRSRVLTVCSAGVCVTASDVGQEEILATGKYFE